MFRCPPSIRKGRVGDRAFRTITEMIVDDFQKVMDGFYEELESGN